MKRDVKYYIAASRGRDPENYKDRTPGNPNLKQVLEINYGEYTNTITSVQKDNYVLRGENLLGKYRIRKLTPRECWRLMGLTSEDCDKASAVGVSSTQLYRQAGNGIVTNCVKLIFQHIYKAIYNQRFVCEDENFTRAATV